MAKKVPDQVKFVPPYDSYLPDDFKYGQQSSTNLNPRRETPIQKQDVLKKIEIRLQEITDDLVRKQIALRPPVERLRGGIGAGESLPSGLPLAKRAAIEATGGVANALIFPSVKVGMDVSPFDTDIEFMVGTFPGPLIDELDLPPELDCDAILSEFFGVETTSDANEKKDNPLDKFKQQAGLENKANDLGDDEEEDPSGSKKKGDGEDDEGEGDGEGSGDDDDSGGDDDSSAGGDDDFDDEDDSGDDDGDDDSDSDDDDDDYDDPGVKECAAIELGWLKILLIIAKIISILKKIIDLVLSILMPIVEIIMLCVGAWINPTNIAKIIQIIIQLVIALIVMLITMIIQLIWDLLNLDCITDSTQATIDEIAKVLSAFASVMSAFNPNAVSMIVKDFNEKIMDPLAGVAEQMKANAKGWMDMKNSVKELFTDPSVIKGVIDKVQTGVVAGVKEQNADKIGKVSGIVGDAKDLFSKDGSLGKVIDAFNSYKNTQALQAQTKKTAKTADGMVQSLQFVGMAFSNSED